MLRDCLPARMHSHPLGVGWHQPLYLSCLTQAQKWLAKKGVKASVADPSPEEAELDKPRPAGLGLGASFLPHHKACVAYVSSERLSQSSMLCVRSRTCAPFQMLHFITAQLRAVCLLGF